MPNSYQAFVPKLLQWLSILFVAVASICSPYIARQGDSVWPYIYYSIAILFSALVLAKHFWQKRSIQVTLIDLAVFLLFGYIFLNRFFYRQDIPYVNDELYVAIIIAILYFPVKLFLVQSYKFLFYCLATICIIEILYGIFQIVAFLAYGTTELPITGTFSNSSMYGSILAISAMPFVSLIKENEQVFFTKKWVIRCILTLVLFLIFLSDSRLGIILFLLQVAFLYKERLPMFAGKWTLRLFLSFVSLLFVLLVFQYKYYSSVGRKFILLVSWQMFRNKPITGWGIGGFGENYMRQQGIYFTGNPNASSEYKYVAGKCFMALNEYLQWAVEMGLVGVMLVVALVWLTIKVIKQYSLPDFRLEIRFLILISLASLVTYITHLTVIILLLLVCTAFFSNHAKAFFTIQAKFCWLLLVIPIAVCAGWFTIKNISSSLAWQEGQRWILEHEQYSLTKYEAAYEYLSYRGPFLYNYGAQLYEISEFRKAIRILKDCEKIYPTYETYIYLGKSYEAIMDNLQAERCYRLAMNIRPGKILPGYFICQLYQQNGYQLLAGKLADSVLAIPIKRHTPETDSIRNTLLNIVHRD